MPKKPGKGYYTVQPGDSPASVAGKLTGDQRNFLRLLEANGGNWKPGQVIRIPSSVNNGPANISNSQAASMGFATTDELQSAYAANGTGGYNSDRLSLGGMGGGGSNVTLPPGPQVAGSAGSGVAPLGHGNNIPVRNDAFSNGGVPGPASPPSVPNGQMGGVIGNQQAQEWITKPPYNAPGPGTSSAAAFRDATATTRNASALPSYVTGQPQIPLGSNNSPMTGLPLAGRNGAYATGLDEILGFKTELKPGEVETKNGMYSSPVPGSAVPDPAGNVNVPNYQYTQQQVSAAEQKIAGGFATMTDYKIKESTLIAQGYSPEDIRKNFEQYHPDQAAKIFGQTPHGQGLPDSATGGWNNPSGPGYTSPSGYFIPYVRKTDTGKDIYDYETGKSHPRTGGGESPPLVQGITQSNMTTGLTDWRY